LPETPLHLQRLNRRRAGLAPIDDEHCRFLVLPVIPPPNYGGRGRQDLTEYTLQTQKRKEFNTKQKKKIGVKKFLC
jgi:hypothetical protein